MKILLITFLSISTLFFPSLKLKAQNIQSISARVIDSNHEPLMGNVLLYIAADPTFKRGLVS